MSHDDALLVAVWDTCCSTPAWLRAGTLVDGLRPDPSRVPAADQPLGALTRRLLDLAREWFGDSIEAVCTCEVCWQQMEIAVPIDDLYRTAEWSAEPPERIAVNVPNHDDVTIRPLTLSDLAVAADAPGTESAGVLLATRALVVPPTPSDEMSAELMEAISAALDEADPMATLVVEVMCPQCGVVAFPTLDLGDWCWSMADAQVRRLLDDVHLLARAYGWTEREILELGPHRRAHYLEFLT